MPAAPDAEPLPVLDALHSTPARRYLSPEPIPDDVIWAILDAAVRGPTGGNQQGWGWVVVTDPAIKERVARWYLEGWNRAYGRRRDEILAAPPAADGLQPALLPGRRAPGPAHRRGAGVDLPGAAPRGGCA